MLDRNGCVASKSGAGMTAYALRTAAAKHVHRSSAYRSAGAVTEANRERSIALGMIHTAVLLEARP